MSKRPARIPTCHPSLPHKAKGLCGSCYERSRPGYRDRQRARCRRWYNKVKGTEVFRRRQKEGAHLRYMKRRHLQAERDKQIRIDRRKEGECPLCLDQKILVFDHCHVRGVFRGWICRECNLMLGHAKDSTDTMRRAIDYLEH